MAKASASQESLALTPTASVSHAGQVLPGPQASPAIAWAEHLPPKLSPEVVQDLVDKFQKNYPGELLGPDSMPSIRLLSMVYDMTKSKHFKWIPWQLRLSARQYQEAMEARSHKVPRPKHSYSRMHSLTKPQKSAWRAEHSRLAGCNKCSAMHWPCAKPCTCHWISKLPACASRSQTPHCPCAQSRPLHRKWSMDDAFHKLTHGRMEIHSLLMLRPKISKAMPALPPAKRAQLSPKQPKRPASRPQKSEPLRKKGKGKGKGKPKNAPQVPNRDLQIRQLPVCTCVCDKRVPADASSIPARIKPHMKQSDGSPGNFPGRCHSTAGRIHCAPSRMPTNTCRRQRIAYVSGRTIAGRFRRSACTNFRRSRPTRPGALRSF